MAGKCGYAPPGTYGHECGRDNTDLGHETGQRNIIMNRRSKIAVRWTTCPAVLGYGTPAEVRKARESAESAAPDFIGSPRTALEYAASIRRKVGDGVMYYVLLTVCATGKPVESDDLRALLA